MRKCDIYRDLISETTYNAGCKGRTPMGTHTPPPESQDGFDDHNEVNELFLDTFARECDPHSEDSIAHAKLQWEHTSSEDREIFTIVAKKRYPDDLEAQETFIRAAMLTEFSKHVLAQMHRTIDEIRATNDTYEEPVRIFAPANHDTGAT